MRAAVVLIPFLLFVAGCTEDRQAAACRAPAKPGPADASSTSASTAPRRAAEQSVYNFLLARATGYLVEPWQRVVIDPVTRNHLAPDVWQDAVRQAPSFPLSAVDDFQRQGAGPHLMSMNVLVPKPTQPAPPGRVPDITLTFSQIGFSEDLQWAVVTMEEVDDAGSYYFLHRHGDTWDVVAEIQWNV